MREPVKQVVADLRELADSLEGPHHSLMVESADIIERLERVQTAITSAAAWGDPQKMAGAAIAAMPENLEHQLMWTDPQLMGVGRLWDNNLAIIAYFKRSLTDDELRALHEFLKWFRL